MSLRETVEVCLLDPRNGKKILIGKRNREPAKGKLTFPGGGIVSGEKPDQAAIRELLEETGVTIPESSLVFLGKTKLIFPDQPERSTFTYIFVAPNMMCETTPVPRDRPSDEMSDPEWRNYEEVRSDFNERTSIIAGVAVDDDSLRDEYILDSCDEESG